MEIQIIGLNMELVNTLIRGLAVLVKLTIGATIGAGILWIIFLILGTFFSE